MKIILFDPISRGLHHAAFNATILNALMNLQHEAELTFISDESQIEQFCIKDISKNNEFVSVSFPFHKKDTNSKVIWGLRMLKCGAFLLKQIKKYKPDLLVYLTVDNTFVPLLTLLYRNNKSLKKLKKIYFFHNNLQNIQQAKSKELIWSSCLNLPNSSVIILSHYLQGITEQLFPNSNNYVLPHPTYQELHQNVINNQNILSKETDYLFLNRQAKEASRAGFLDWFYNTISSITNEGNCVDIKVPENTPVPSISQINTQYYKSYPPYFSYLQMIIRSRFVIFPPTSENRLTASGALADMVSLGTPVIGPKFGPFIEQLPIESHELLYKDLDELNKILIKASNMKLDNYMDIQSILLQFAKKNALIPTSQRLSDIINKI